MQPFPFKVRVFYLSTSTFAGMCPGAKHWSGRVRKSGDSPFDPVDFEYKNPKRATGRFTNRRDVVRAAQQWFWKNCQNPGDILASGDYAACGPVLVLDWNDERVYLYAIDAYLRANKLHWWSGTEEQQRKMYRVCDEWERQMQLRT